MKKFILALAITAVTSLTFAQIKMKIGVKAGLTIPNLTSGNSDNPLSFGYRSLLAGSAAIHAEFYTSRYFSIQPQLEYSPQGGKKSGIQAFTTPTEISQQFPAGMAPAFLYADYKSRAEMHYIMLPILAKYHLNLKKKWSTYIAAGPFASYLLSAKNITKGTSIIYLDKYKAEPLNPVAQSFDSKNNITSDLHRFNTGISGHLGVDYKIAGGCSAFIEAGGNYGLVDIQKNSSNGKNKTGAAVIYIGYQCKL
ncbi:PorT family protein [Niabella sp. CC-SYL272]|uniref:porin family protein n=1 Tax=Niabella agricola TaxID=2891571 RepID=UPI001F42CF3B|nr:porin family protein [Niabella agricola]MCF3107690.1 PorT family protein [Niabella agricola]